MRFRFWTRRSRRTRTAVAPAPAVPEPMGSLGPPGWYRDPAGSRRLRWFDGRHWSDRYRDTPNVRL